MRNASPTANSSGTRISIDPLYSVAIQLNTLTAEGIATAEVLETGADGSYLLTGLAEGLKLYAISTRNPERQRAAAADRAGTGSMLGGRHQRAAGAGFGQAVHAIQLIRAERFTHLAGVVPLRACIRAGRGIQHIPSRVFQPGGPGQNPGHGTTQRPVNLLRVGKTNFGLLGMNVHVHLARIHLQQNDRHRVAAHRQQGVVGLLDGKSQAAVAHPAPVDKERDLLARAAMVGRLADIAGDADRRAVGRAGTRL